MLPCIIVYYTMDPFVYIQNMASDLSFKVDDYLISIHNPMQDIINKKMKIKQSKYNKVYNIKK